MYRASILCDTVQTGDSIASITPGSSRRGLVILQNTGWMMRRASKWYHARPLVWMTAWNTLEKSHRSNHQVIESSARHQTRSLYDNVLGESAQFSSHVKIGDIPHSQLSQCRIEVVTVAASSLPCLFISRPARRTHSRRSFLPRQLARADDVDHIAFLIRP